MNLIAVAFYLAAFSILVIAFDIGLSANKRFKLNRVILLGIPILSASVIWFPELEQVQEVTLIPAIMLPVVEPFFDQVHTDDGHLGSLLLAGYTVISVLLMLRFVIRALREFSAGVPVQRTYQGYLIRLIPGAASYSLFGRIYLSKDDLDNELILKHESIHILQQHSLDLVYANMLCACCWINPFAWRWKLLIEQNHEFLADDEMFQNSNKAADYIHLLLDKALDTQQFSLGNYFSLNSLTSKRIIMMNKNNKQNKWKTGIILSGMAVCIGILGACNKNESTPTSSTEPEVATEQVEVLQKAEVMPSYEGGWEAMYAYMGKSVNYPESCKEEEIEGTVYVQFVVSKTGALQDIKLAKGVHADLDAEALRVVSEMPSWIPGSHEGQAVPIQMTLPIKFAMGPKA